MEKPLQRKERGEWEKETKGKEAWRHWVEMIVEMWAQTDRAYLKCKFPDSTIFPFRSKSEFYAEREILQPFVYNSGKMPTDILPT